jgi:HK97 family phage major capsid protein
MDPELKALLDQAKQAIGLHGELKAAIDEIKAWGVEKGRLAEAEKAVQQVNDQVKTMAEDFKKRLDNVARQVYDGHGNYRGRCFHTETQARTFGLVALLATSSFGKKAAEMLEADHKDWLTAQRATGTAHTGESSMVAHEHSTAIERLIEDYGAARQLFRVMPVTAPTGTWHARAAGMRAHKTKVRTAVAEQTGSWTPLNWSIDDYDILCSYPLSLSEDMIVPFAEMLADEMSLGFAIAEDENMFLGDGTDTYDNVVGAIPRLINVNGVDDGGGLVLASGNLWSEIIEADILKLIGQARYVRPGQGRFACSNEFFWQVLAKITTSKGGVTMRESESGPRFMFNGIDVKITPVMPRVQGNSQVPLLYGDFKLAGTLYSRRQLEMRESREVRFESKEVVLLATERVDMDVHTIGTAATAGPLVGLITQSS